MKEIKVKALNTSIFIDDLNEITDGEIATSNTFTDFDEARQFYESIGDDEMKEFLQVDKDGYIIEEIECNYGH